MPRTNWFLPTSVVTQSNDSEITWTNTSYLTTQTGTPTQTNGQTLCLNTNTDLLICKNFNAQIPLGTPFTMVEFLLDVKRGGIGTLFGYPQSQNVYLRYDNANYGANRYGELAWGLTGVNYLQYSDTAYDLTKEIVEDDSFGIVIDAANFNSVSCFIAIVNSIKMRLYYDDVNPKFYYNGGFGNEVNVTLDLNPAVTNPTTTFSVLDGLDNGPAGYMFGSIYTEPQPNDPSGDGYDELLSLGVGVYTNNYMSTPNVTKSAPGATYTLSNHVMTYNTTNLIAGNTYRRGLVLLNLIELSGLEVTNANIFDTLYFNITVIDTRYKTRNTGTYGNFVI